MRPGEFLNSQSQQLVLNLLEYFQKENEHGGPLLSIKAVQRRVGEALKIDEKTVRKIAKNDKENVEPQASVKRNRKKSKTELHDGVKYEIKNVITTWCMVINVFPWTLFCSN